jgi:ketosteroid isomerase-like protein
MSRENVELVRHALDASMKGDLEPFIAMLAPDIVWDTSRSSFPEARIYHGIDSVREWFRDLGVAFEEEVRYEIEELRDLGDRVLLELRAEAAGRSTRIGVDRRFVPVFTFRDGKVVRMDRYADRAEALAEMGLSE